MNKFIEGCQKALEHIEKKLIAAKMFILKLKAAVIAFGKKPPTTTTAA